jgi:hypothetical protein
MRATHSYGGKTFDVPQLIGGGVVFYPSKQTWNRPEGQTWQYFSQTWDLDRFAAPQRPSLVGWAAPGFSTRRHVRILDMPIKLAGSNEYRLPQMLLPWQSTIKQIVETEHGFNPDVLDFYAYLTVDQGFVNQGHTQRQGGCHVDGFQGARLPQKNRINRSYVVSDRDTTICFLQKFLVQKLDEARHDFFLEFDLQADWRSAWRPEPYQIMLMNAYNVHQAAEVSEDCYRTFLRLSYDVREFDRLGNTHNPMFEYQWEMVPRTVHDSLVQYR